jgi:large subunit ribosomal protein L15
MRAGFEGGQMPIYMRMGKQRGSTSKDAMPIGPHRTVSQGVNVRDLERVFESGAEVTLEALKEKRLIRSLRVDVKILGEGELTKGLTVTAHRFSQAARGKIEAAGGAVVALREPSETKSRKARKVAAAKRAAGIVPAAEADEAEDTAAPDSPPEEPESSA